MHFLKEVGISSKLIIIIIIKNPVKEHKVTKNGRRGFNVKHSSHWHFSKLSEIKIKINKNI